MKHKKRIRRVHIRRLDDENLSLCGRAKQDLALTLESAKHHPVDENERGVVCVTCDKTWMAR